MRRPAERFGAAVLLASVAGAALTGCTSASRESLDRYVEALDAVPGVTIDDYNITTPLPASVQGTVTVSLAADAATFAELRTVACETEVDASVSLSIRVHAGATSVYFDRVSPCGRPLVDQVDLALATESFGVDLSIEYFGDLAVRVAGAENLAATLEALRVTTDFLPAGLVGFAGDGFSLATVDLALATAYLDDFTELVAAFGVAQIDLQGQSLVIRVSPASDAQGVREFLAARDPERYAALEILVTDAGAGDVPPGTDVSVVQLRDRMVAELGISATISGDSVNVLGEDGADVVALSRQIAAINPAAVRVEISIPEDPESGVPAFRQRVGPALTTASNPYPAWIRQYDRLAATELVQTVEVGDGTLAAWLTDADYDDPDAFATVQAVLDDLAEEYDLTHWRLNNLDLS